MPSQPIKQQKPLLRFWNGWLKFELPLLIISSLMMAIVAATSSSYPNIIRAIVDALAVLQMQPEKIVFMGFSAKQIAVYGPLIIIVISFIRGIAWYLSIITSNKAALVSTTRLQNDLFAKLLTLDYDRVAREQPGAFSSRFLNDVNAIRESVLKVANSLVRESLTLFGLIITLIYSDWQLAIVTLIILPIGIYPINIIGKKLLRTSNLTQAQASQLSGVIEESLGGVRLVKTYGLEEQEASRVNKSLLERMRLILKSVSQKGRVDPILELIGGLTVAAVFAFAAYRIVNGQSTIGALMAFITALLLAAQSVRALGNMSAQLQEGIAGLNRFYAILDEEPKIKSKPDAIALTDPKGEIAFDHVNFEIDGNQILKDINFKINPGQVVAFVGLSGAGKSTIINLVPRLFDVQGGAVKFDGFDVKDLKLDDLRHAVALVSQDAVLFETTVAENVCFGAGQKSESEIISALKAAACDFVFKLPDGIYSMVAPRGSNFSGGEKQRLSIARAILRNAPVLLLDEPTSALDSENEAKIAETMKVFSRNRTTLVVAHRLSTVKTAHMIMVMQNGTIVESGTHDELIKKGGAYSDLVKLQLS